MIILILSTASAQDVVSGGDVPEGLNSQVFRPSVDAERTLWTDDTLLANSGYTSARFLLSYANDPLAYVNGAGERTELVSDLFQLDLLGAHTRGPVRFGLDVPLYLRSAGEATGGETGLGDVTAGARYTVLDRRRAPLGAALAVGLTLPTATVDAPLGNSGLAWEINGIIDKEIGNALVALNLGHRGLPEVALENVTWDDQFTARLGVGYDLSDRTGLSADFSSNITYGSGTDGLPMEVLGGVYRRLNDKLVLRAGLGSGLNSSVGTPKIRAVFALGYEPPRGALDTDGDGLTDDVDDCIEQPEDIDSVADEDGCPEPTLVTVSFIDGSGAPVSGVSWSLGDASGTGDGQAELYGGTYSLAGTADGYESIQLSEEIPDAPNYALLYTLDPAGLPGSLLVHAVDSEGVPVEGAVWQLRGTDHRGLAVDTSADVPSGEHNLIVTAAGYGPGQETVMVQYQKATEATVVLEPTEIEITQESIDIKDSVYFETNRAVILSDSHQLLDDVSSIIVAHPELLKIRIEGHTDSRGSAENNLQLSQERAESVRRYLIDHGVEPERLEATGYGETRPLVRGENESAWSKNRRVDFAVTERED